MIISNEFKEKARVALLEHRKLYSGSDAAFAKQFDISASQFSRVKNGQIENILDNSKWVHIGREFGVNLKGTSWKIARTEVYIEIESNITFCKQFSKAMILVDQWGIGKTASAKDVVKKLEDAFYLDCSQAKTKHLFTRSLAKAIGLDSKGKYVDVKENVKYYLKLLDHPIVVLDDAGDLEYNAFMDLKEYWNGTEDSCGWYMIGDDSLQNKITKAIDKKKVGYGAVLSRFSDQFISLVPVDKKRKQDFMMKLVADVASVNVKSKTAIPKLVKQCVGQQKTLRNLKTLIQLQA